MEGTEEISIFDAALDQQKIVKRSDKRRTAMILKPEKAQQLK